MQNGAIKDMVELQIKYMVYAKGTLCLIERQTLNSYINYILIGSNENMLKS